MADWQRSAILISLIAILISLIVISMQMQDIRKTLEFSNELQTLNLDEHQHCIAIAKKKNLDERMYCSEMSKTWRNIHRMLDQQENDNLEMQTGEDE